MLPKDPLDLFLIGNHLFLIRRRNRRGEHEAGNEKKALRSHHGDQCSSRSANSVLMKIVFIVSGLWNKGLVEGQSQWNGVSI